MATKQRLAQALCVVAVLSAPFTALCDDAAVQRELDLIKEQNRVLQEQVKKLTDKVSALEESKDANGPAYNDSATKTNHSLLSNIKLGVQGGLGWQISNFNRNAPFFVDDVKLSLDARLSKHISFFSDVNLSAGSRYVGVSPVFTGSSHSTLTLNELYVDFEDLLDHWGHGQLLNVRAGQFYTPFGDYLENRYPFDNPLVAHSLPDIWGLAPGLELYGAWNKLSYAVAAQNRNQTSAGLGNPDKLVSGKIGYQVTDYFDVSGSALRTGALQPGEGSTILFHDATFVGPPSYVYSIVIINGTEYATSVPVVGDSHAEIGELDARLKWKSGYVKGWGGVLYSGSDYHAAGTGFNVDSSHHSWYYGVEAVQDLTPRLYVAGRAGQILDTLDSLRLSGGVGYRFTDHLVLKTDFTYDESVITGYMSFKRYVEVLSGELAFRF